MTDEGRVEAGALSKNETLKAGSDALRGTLAQELVQAGLSVGGQAANLLKFHGVYQQDDREARAALRQSGEGGRRHSFMVRTKLPGGYVTAAAYLELDRIAGQYGNGTLRITTRQDIQLHGVLKRNLRRTLTEINARLITTLGACGDVVRNVCCCPAPTSENARLQLFETARLLSDHFLPRTRAYAELFLDGEPFGDSPGSGDDETAAGAAPARNAGEEEPFYGAAYLPRKFKIGLALPHDNCIDVHTNDLGLLAVLDGETLRGWDLLAGGGLGMSFGAKNTYPRLSSPIGFIAPEQLVEAVEAVVSVQRDHGNRSDRKQARLKYLIDRRGVEWFHNEVAARMSSPLLPAVNQEVTSIEDHTISAGVRPGMGRTFSVCTSKTAASRTAAGGCGPRYMKRSPDSASISASRRSRT